MKPTRLSVLILLGKQDRYLVDVRESWPIHGPNQIIRNIDSMLESLVTLKFPVTLAAADDLRQLRKELGETPKEATLSKTQALRLTGIMDKLRSTLRAESNIQVAYVLTEKRFGVQKLVEQPESFFAKDTFAKLPLLAQRDIKEAGKCIGFELPTAGAFHLLRATEDTLRSYQKIFVRRGSKGNIVWGQLIHTLRGKKHKPRPDETLLNHLDHIRKNFRNPTDHPEMTYDLDGVQDLFSLVVDALNRMAKELPATKDGPVIQKVSAASLISVSEGGSHANTPPEEKPVP